ncbi:MAG: hypothetical protein J07AB43_12950 [Candidatus Nanosalina sp. J07AB43]|jgi:hypothetical protein|nr:MAG: hypothetical protein J07AB43_12950 [Candidatus Nanosalina sp. J07AB43]
MSTAAKVELYISKRPHIKEALAEDVINYSALARKICSEEKIESEDAVKAAVSRYQDFVAENRTDKKSRVKEVLENSSLTIRSDISVEKSNRYNSEAVISAKTENGFTNMVSGGEKSLVAVESPGKLEETPGVIEFVLSSLAAENINVDQLISCREDTHLVVGQEDGPKVLELLQERIN